MERVDPLVGGELLVGLEEVLRSRLRGGRRRRGGAKQLVERVRVELDVVAEALGAEADVERDDAQVREALLGVGEVGGRIEDDGRVLVRQHQVGAPVAGRAAARTAPTISSSD